MSGPALTMLFAVGGKKGQLITEESVMHGTQVVVLILEGPIHVARSWINTYWGRIGLNHSRRAGVAMKQENRNRSIATYLTTPYYSVATTTPILRKRTLFASRKEPYYWQWRTPRIIGGGVT